MNNDNSILFVYGPARGGTTYLGNMLFTWFGYGMGPEGGFVERFYKKLPKYGDLNEDANLHRLVEDVANCDMLDIMRNKWQKEFRKDITPEMILSELKERSFAGVVRSVFTNVSLLEKKTRIGNKFPGYWRHLDVLNELFPDDAKYLCIVRDGRDVALSLFKQQWGRMSSYAAAKDWVKMLDATEQLKRTLPENRVEVIRYEELLSSPKETIAKLVAFTGVAFDAEEQQAIVQSILDNPMAGNYDKWRTQMSQSDLYQFEAVAGTCLKQHGYTVTNDDAVLGWHKIFYFEGMEFLRKVMLTLKSWMRSL